MPGGALSSGAPGRYRWAGSGGGITCIEPIMGGGIMGGMPCIIGGSSGGGAVAPIWCGMGGIIPIAAIAAA